MSHRSGFTLLEMSIVILIIGLITAGIMTGKTLIRQAEIRAITQEYDRYVKATREFLDKYHEMPGDLSNAEDLWGTDDDSAVNPCPNLSSSTTVTTGTLTCNGDGDGKIGNCNGDLGANSGSCSDVSEIWRAWQQLALAGFIEGRYTGRPAGPQSSLASVSVNVPASKFKPAGWTLLYYINTADDSWLPGGHYGHVLLFGGTNTLYSGYYTTAPVLPVDDTQLLDNKIDDGSPATGILRAWKDYWMPSGSQYCVNGTSYYTLTPASYSELEQLCSLVFVPGF